MRFEEVYGKQRERRLSVERAAEILGVSERTFRRWRARYEEEGAAGLDDRRLGAPSPRRAAEAEVKRLTQLYRERFQGFTVRHFLDYAGPRHGIGRSYTWVKTTLQRARLVEKAPRRGAHRRKRPRRPLVGMMLHRDGSKHLWIPGLGRPVDLIVTFDDATSEVYSAFLAEEENTNTTLQGLIEVISEHGLFGSLYADRGSHYWHTPKAGGPVDRERLTQVGRALAQLGITLIPAGSPEARGRCERLFGTWQGRLPKELELNGIATLEAANRYLREVFVADHNRRFTVPATDAGSAFVPYVGRDLRDILCVQEERVVGNDNCVRYQGRCLQIPPQRHRHHYVKATVRVHEYPDGRLAVLHGPSCLARYDAGGKLLAELAPNKRAA